MRLPQMRHCALSAVVLCAAFGSLGCPKLNRWSGPSQDPFFSVVDRVGPGQHEPPVRETSQKFEAKKSAIADDDFVNDDVVSDDVVSDDVVSDDVVSEDMVSEDMVNDDFVNDQIVNDSVDEGEETEP